METDLLRTFLELSRTRHFGRAARNLCLTSSAVSARIRLLEGQLGVQLLTRQRNEIGLTAAGERLLPRATAVLALWEKTRREIAVGEHGRQLVVAAPQGLWDSLAAGWASRLWEALPELALRLEVMNSAAIRDALAKGLVDLGLMFDPPGIPELDVLPLNELPIHLYATDAVAEAGPVPGGRYILVDWGAAFAEQHAQRFPQMGAPLARVATARLALALLEENHGSAYLTEAIAAPALVSGRLQRVADAQDFRLGVIAAWRQHGEAAADIRLALELLRPPPG